MVPGQVTICQAYGSAAWGLPLPRLPMSSVQVSLWPLKPMARVGGAHLSSVAPSLAVVQKLREVEPLDGQLCQPPPETSPLGSLVFAQEPLAAQGSGWHGGAPIFVGGSGKVVF